MNSGEYPPGADSLMAILRRLRAPDGCPWDRRQTRQSLARHLAGECGELIDAIDRDEPGDICDELGDVLMNLLFQVVIAEEKGEFTLEDVWRNIIAKMIRRHAHVFGDAVASTPEEVTALWNRIKAAERAGEPRAESVLDGAGHTLSPLDRAEALQKKASECGFDWPDFSGVMDKFTEECSELRAAENDDEAFADELGDVLFAAVNLARFRRLHAGEVMRRANRKFERRFRAMEQLLAAAGLSVADADAEKLDEMWNQVKAEERSDHA